jgi:hypothetical protein
MEREEPTLITDDTFDRRTRIMFGAERIQDEADVSRKVSEGGLFYSKGIAYVSLSRKIAYASPTV